MLGRNLFCSTSFFWNTSLMIFPMACAPYCINAWPPWFSSWRPAPDIMEPKSERPFWTAILQSLTHCSVSHWLGHFAELIDKQFGLTAISLCAVFVEPNYCYKLVNGYSSWPYIVEIRGGLCPAEDFNWLIMTMTVTRFLHFRTQIAYILIIKSVLSSFYIDKCLTILFIV